MTHHVSREQTAELGRLHNGMTAARFTGEATINAAIAAGQQIMAELESAYQQRLAAIVAECGLPEGTVVTVNFDTGEVTPTEPEKVPA